MRKLITWLIAAVATFGALVASPASAAILNGVQSGSQTMPAGAATQAVTLPRTVDSTKAFVICSHRTGTDGPNRRPSCKLATDGASITIAQNANDATTIVQWTVADFQSGVSVQRGTASFGTGETQPGGTTVTLSPAVDLTKSFVVFSERANSALMTLNEEHTIRARLTGTTTLELQRLESGIAVDVEWQVIEMQGASVQRGTLCIGASGTCSGSNGLMNTATLATAVDSSKSFLLISHMANTAVAGIEAEYLVGGDFTTYGTAVTGLTFARTATVTTASHDVQIAYEVVTMSDGTAVRRGQSGQITAFGANTTTLTSTTFTAVDLSRTVPFVSMTGGATTGQSDLEENETAWTAVLGTTTFTFTRTQNNKSASIFGWQAVQFFRCDSDPLCAVSARAGSGTATVRWAPIYDASCVTLTSTPLGVCNALVLRGTGSVQVAPTNGVVYVAGILISSGGNSATVVHSGTANDAATMVTAFTESGLTNGTTVCYKVFYKTGAALTTYVNVSSSTGCTATSEVIARPAAGNTLWSYTLSGGAALTPPIPGFGQVFASGNAKKVFSLDSSTGASGGTQLDVLTQTHDAVQSYVSWFPVSFGSEETVIAADLAGYLYAIDAATGAVRWTKKLAADGFIAAVNVQLAGNMFTPQSWRDAYQTNHGYLGDVIYVATRNTSSTVNQVFGLKATDGTVLWTFTPATSMDKVVAQPWVDYARNRIYVPSLAGFDGTQLSLRVISSTTGAEIACNACAGLGDIETPPSLSFDNNTLYVGAKDGKVHAITADTLNLKWTFVGASGKRIKGFIWEDFETAGRLYFVAEGASSDEVWAAQDNGASAATVWTKTPAANQRMSQPIIGYSAIPYLWTGSSNGNLYQLRLSDGEQLTEGGAAQSPFQVGDGTKQVGDASTEDLTALFVGTSGGTIYKIQVPLP